MGESMKKYFKLLLSILSLIVLFTLFGCKVNDNSSGDNLSKGKMVLIMILWYMIMMNFIIITMV